jgi:diguanylate cyclase (GGDEF)-like protein/PAS domain S-box-containing protein
MLKAISAKISPDEVVAKLQASRILATIVRGILWIDAANQRFRADPIARVLLELGASAGDISELGKLFETQLASSNGPKATHTIAFATPGNRYLRMRSVCTTNGEQLFLIEDMTDIVLGELKLHDNDQAFRGLFENASTGMYRANLSGEHVSANPALVSMMGLSTQDEWLALGREGQRNLFLDADRYEQFIAKLNDSKKIVDHVCELKKPDGETFWVSISAWYVNGVDGKPSHIDGTITDVSERMQHFSLMKKAAETDELTGLLNRQRLYKVMEERISASGEPEPFAVMLIDLDKFKDINDVYGHSTGDEVLLTIAQRLKSTIGEMGVVARLGGDEFAVIQNLGTDKALVQSVRAQLLAALRKPVHVGGIDHALSGSIGISCYPEHAMDRADLLRKADIALYNVKARGRNDLCVFTHAFEVSRQRTHFLAQELRHADKRGELELHYQPIVQAGDGKIQGFEALMRWHHPKRGTVSPMEFIPIAEDAGYMGAFGSWAIREACAHIVTLPKHIFVSVNVSAVQFNAIEFPSIVEAALKETGLDPSRLELEVTEGIVLRNEERTIAILDKLKKIGVSIALDDFGTGYSSFGYLQKFPFDKVKIDRSFVRNLAENKTNAALVRAVLSIGRDLGLPVVAEGVENIEQRDQLRAAGCPLFQGFLYGKPIPFLDAANTVAMEALQVMDPPVVYEPEIKQTA